MVIRTYLKMDPDERESAKKDLESLHSIFTIGFLTIGSFFASLGNLLTLNIIKYPGMAFMFIAGITITVDIWRRNKIKVFLAPILIAISIFILMKS
ncbi:hypothetical protein [Virgibacillus sp. MSP4-1]|uniref:hypothetical protein n=1 Tax=Virgibacillus sp. MSP4-1 TaxID=2700081 RepID=UPI00039B001D|nr:hypothetical protein [Virgibacillus sp. MSP4-1]